MTGKSGGKFMKIESKKRLNLKLFRLVVLLFSLIASNFSYALEFLQNNLTHPANSGANSFTISYNYMLCPAICGVEYANERNVASDFTVVQASLSIVHACFVPLRFGLENDGLYEMKWDVVIPVFATDVASGLLGGHLGGMICKGWLRDYEATNRVFLKSFVSGLFSGVVWGIATSSVWFIATNKYPHSEDYAKYDRVLYGSVAGGILLSSLLHPMVVIFLK